MAIEVINALHLHFDENPFVDSSGQNKLLINNGVIITPVPVPSGGGGTFWAGCPTGTRPPVGWTWHFETNPTYLAMYECEAVGDNPLGSNSINKWANGAATGLHMVISKDGIAPAPSQHVLALFKHSSSGGYIRNCMVVLRGQDPTTYYNVHMRGFTEFGVQRIVNGVSGNYVSGSLGFTNTDVLVWCRAQIIGTEIRAKWWLYGTTEPVLWHVGPSPAPIQYIDSVITGSGFTGLGSNAATDEWSCYYFDGVIDESTIPVPPPLSTTTVSAGIFDGTSDLEINKSNSLTLAGNENWEVDTIIEHADLTGTQMYYSQYDDANNRCHLGHVNGSGLEFLFRYGGVDLISLTGTEITDADRHHVALSKEGDTFRLFLDGINVAETTYSFGNELIDSNIFIGQDGNSTNYFVGNMLTFRISNTTRFINIFSPDMSGSFIRDEDTQLLINFNGTTVSDEAQAGVSLWNPTQVTRGNVDTGLRVYRFGNQCGYFPGSQDGFYPYSLRVGDNPNWNIGDREFTLDTWLYPLSHFNYAGIMLQNTRWYWYMGSAGKLHFYIEDGPATFTMDTSGTVPLNEWSHCALTRRTENFIDGVSVDTDGEEVLLYSPDLAYKFEENLNDSSGGGNAASFVNGSLSYVNGYNGKAVQGELLTNKYINSPYASFGPTFSLGDGFTVSFWYEMPAGQLRDYHINNWRNNIWFYGQSGINDRSVFINFDDEGIGPVPSDNIWLRATTWGTNAYHTYNFKRDVNTWFHITVVWLQTNGGVDTKLYVDGALIGSQSIGAVNLSTVTQHVIMNNEAANASPIGKLDEFMIWDRPLSDDEITILPTGTGSSQVWRMYIKGIRQIETVRDFTIPNLTGPMWIGRGTTDSDLYHGYMDELRLLLNKAVWTEDEFWPFDYPYFSEAIVHRYRRMHRRRIHSIQGR